jgi:TatD DNase family protein
VLVDSHCHLADAAFEADLPAVVGRARAAGLGAALCIVDAGSPEESGRAARVAEAWPEVRFAAGVHPHQAGEYAGRVDEAAAVVSRALETLAGARAVGEIGLDFHYDFSAPDVQREVLAAQASLAAARDLPVVVHAREAEREVLDLLQREGGGRLGGVFHCYTGDVPTARRVLDLGFHVGIGGIVTFPRGDNVREIARFVPLDRLLVETDSPFLAPVPFRGKRNEPAWVVHVARTVGDLLGLGPEAVAEQTTRNFTALFGA